MNTLPSQTEHFLVNTLLLQDHVIVPSPQILRLLESELSSNYLINSAPLYLSIVFYILDGLLELFHTIAVLPLKELVTGTAEEKCHQHLLFCVLQLLHDSVGVLVNVDGFRDDQTFISSRGNTMTSRQCRHGSWLEDI